MKVAVCFFGYPSFYDLGIKSFEHFLEDIEYDFFMHFWCDKNITNDDYDILYNDIDRLYKPKKFTLDRQLDFNKKFDFDIDLSELKKEYIEKGVAVHNTLSPIYSIKRVGQLLEESGQNYDLVIFTRTDCFSIKRLKDYVFDDLKIVYSSFCSGDIWNLNGSGIAIDAKMILSNMENMIFFSNLYDNVEKYLKSGIKIGHHTMFAYHLRKICKNFKMMFNSENWYLIRSNGNLENERYNSHLDNYSKIFKKNKIK